MPRSRLRVEPYESNRVTFLAAMSNSPAVVAVRMSSTVRGAPTGSAGSGWSRPPSKFVSMARSIFARYFGRQHRGDLLPSLPHAPGGDRLRHTATTSGNEVNDT